MTKHLDVKNHNEASLLKTQNVVGTAIGEKWANGVPTGEDAVLVFVEKKYSKRSVISKFSSNEMVPSSIDGVPTDVIEVGVITKEAGFKNKVRPVQPGYSCGHRKVTAGTIGGFFRDKNGEPVLLSNNHVIANENNAKAGDIIYQPGPMDNRGNLRFRGWTDPVANLPYIGTLKRFVRIKRTGNNQDSAIALIHPKLIRDGLINDLYPHINQRFAGFGTAKVGGQVQKCGRTTGYTIGRVIGSHASFTVGYDFGGAKFHDCVVLSNMSAGGDSGSIIYDMDMKAVGLLFAGSPKVTIANPMALVAQYYGLKPWSTSNVRPPGAVPGGGGVNWVKRADSGTSIAINKNKVINIEANANKFCYYETGSNASFNSASCIVNTGTDNGATWGPGLVVQWATGMLKVNLRKNGSFGGYYNSNYNLSVGKTQAGKSYPIRIRKTSNTWVGEVQDLRKWHKVVEVPISLFPHNPIAIRVGKTALLGDNKSYHRHGKVGKCSISDVKIS